MTTTEYDVKRERLLQEFNESRIGESVGLNKSTSNLFRKRDTQARKLDVRGFNKVISVDTKAETITVEGMTTFDELTKEALKFGMTPLVVPELKTITIGGAVSGMAIESSSFRYGLVHESVLSMDVLTGAGEVITCTPDGPHKDLFYGLPNSYGTLGYILKLTIKARRAAPFVHLHHVRFSDMAEYFTELKSICLSGMYEGQTVDFIDGTVFRADELFITLGFSVDAAPFTSDYTYKDIYYQSIREKEEDYLTIYDYLWRWDTDWFWCSKNVFADRPLVRRLLGRRRLGSKTYSKIMYFESRHKIYERLVKLFGQYRPTEDVIQDIEVPIEKAETFLKAFQETIGISPIWICPTKAATDKWPYTLYPMKPNQLYVNFGFWDVVPAKGNPKDAYFNKEVESLVYELGGMKSLYSSSYYERERFEKLYNYPNYMQLKRQYDPSGRFKELYEKCVVSRTK